MTSPRLDAGRLTADSSKNSNSSVKAEPLEQMASSLYNSHFGKAPTAPHPLGVSMAPHEAAASVASTGMLTGLPHLTPAPFNSHSMHQSTAFSLEDMKYNSHSHHPHHTHVPHQTTDYFASAASAAATSMPPGGVFQNYASLATPTTDHSSHQHHHHHHPKLNLQTT